MFCRCKILRYHTLSHEQNQFTIQSTIRLWTTITHVAGINAFPPAHLRPLTKGMPQQASPPLCPGARGQFLDLDIGPKSCMYESTMYGTRPLKSIWYFVVKLSCQFAHMHIFFRTLCDNVFVDLRSMVIKTNAKEGEIQKTSAVQTSTKPVQRFEKP